MAWSVSDIPDLSACTSVVTGGSVGLGLETALALAGAGAHVVIAARNEAKADRAAGAIAARHPLASLEVVSLDLSSLGSVHSAAGAIAARHPRLDLLVNNAGVMGVPERRSSDGFELQWATNHLGHFALTALLLPALLRAEAARVVTVTSTARHLGRPVEKAGAGASSPYRPWSAYGMSKLANYHFGIGLQRRFASARARAASLMAHPGLSHTELQTTSVKESGGGRSQRFFQWLAATVGTTPARGALAQLRAGTDPTARGGELYTPRYVNWGPPVRRPVLPRPGLEHAIAELWELSQQQAGVSLDVRDQMAAIGR